MTRTNNLKKKKTTQTAIKKTKAVSADEERAEKHRKASARWYANADEEYVYIRSFTRSHLHLRVTVEKGKLTAPKLGSVSRGISSVLYLNFTIYAIVFRIRATVNKDDLPREVVKKTRAVN